ncbi:hypothetical protein [Pontiella sp.]|uniref:hypothetical protein n=1 Tax=Pontiella sp. TaxID=2837462 RepID=UPI003564337F
MKITKREMTLGVITLACVLGGLTWYVINGKADAHKAKKTEIANLRQEIRIANTRIKLQEEWIEELNELQQDLRVFDTKQKSVSPELMKTVNTIAKKHDLDISRSQPRSEKPTGDLFELGINCTWSGKLDALVDFLTELQQQGVRYDVRTLNVKPMGKNTGKLTGNMIIHCAYTRKPGEERTVANTD